MKRSSLTMASAAVGGVMLLGVAAAAHAQGAPRLEPIGRVAALAPGSITGVVLDEKGTPVQGAMVSALGATPSFAVTDRGGHFLLPTLSPGPYLVRAHLSGFVASRGQIVDVRPSGCTSSAIALRHAASASTATAPILAAGIGAPPSDAPAHPEPPAADAPARDGSGDEGETAWRLRHARRSVLRDTTLVPGGWLDAEFPDDHAGGFLARAVATPARVADFLGGAEVSGQFNLLTAGSFDSPLQMLGTDTFANSVANVSLGAAAGSGADWTVRGALSEGQIDSWIVAGSYTTRPPARHRYDVGMSYAAQRYDVGNPAMLVAVTTTREGGMVSAFDTFAATDEVAITYGARFARYDYLADRNVISPRVGVTVAPLGAPFRLTALVSRRSVAPGAEEFMPPGDSAVWLPPQRTFSSLISEQRLRAEQTDHFDVGYEQDIAPATTVTVHAFRQRTTGQLVTMFGLDRPTAAAGKQDHYFVTDNGDTTALGWSAGVRTVIAGRVHGAVSYSQADTSWARSANSAFVLLLTPSAARLANERIRDVTASVETEIPESATRLLVLYRVSDGFARPQSDRPGVESRFDVQVHQSLPFMNFSSAQWEALFAIRNFFHDTAPDQSLYDELLVVRPPKRVVGGLTLRF